MQQRMIRGVLLLVGVLGAACPASAQHPVDVQRLTAQGEYFLALSTYERMPKRIATTDSVVAAARSAWALSLNARAMEEFDRALREGTLSPEAKARIFLSKGIIEFQEGHFQVASLHAERAVSVIDAQGGSAPSALRAKSYLLWGDALARLSTYGEAERRYVNALADAAAEDLPQIHYSLGQCRLKLGKYEAARVDFESVPLKHELTPSAIRNLAMIALDTGKMKSASFWLKKGRAEYPDSFLDSWVDYALLRIAMSENDQVAVREVRAAATKKYPPSDPWLNLLQAAAEGFEWARLKPGLGREG